MNLGEPPLLPHMVIPDAPTMPVPILDVPKPQIPSYRPLVVPPADLRPPPGIKGKPLEGAQPRKKPQPTPKVEPQISVPKAPEIDYVTVPYINKEVPIPSQEILVTAVSTAVVSVAATLTATAVFKHLVSIFKPLVKTAWTKITKKKTLSDS